MSNDEWHYFRATVDIGTQDTKLARHFRENLGFHGTDEPLGRELFESIRKGRTEVDSVSDLEDHGHS